MALDATRLGTALAAALSGDPATGAQAGDALNAFCQRFAESLVNELTTNAEALPAGTLLDSGGHACTGKGKIG